MLNKKNIIKLLIGVIGIICLGVGFSNPSSWPFQLPCSMIGGGLLGFAICS